MGLHLQRELAEAQTKPSLQRPPRYRVVMDNDDYTPMEFVVQVLRLIFGLDTGTSTAVMLAIHNKGSAVCGVYTLEVAETLVAQVIHLAERYEHPLMVRLEPDDPDDDG